MVLEDGKSYLIQVRFSDDTIEEKNIISPDGTYTVSSEKVFLKTQ